MPKKIKTPIKLSLEKGSREISFEMCEEVSQKMTKELLFDFYTDMLERLTRDR